MVTKMSGWQFFRRQNQAGDEGAVHLKEIKKVFKDKSELSLEEREQLENIENLIFCDCEKDC